MRENNELTKKQMRGGGGFFGGLLKGLAGLIGGGGLLGFLLTGKSSTDLDRKSTRLNSSHSAKSRMPSSA